MRFLLLTLFAAAMSFAADIDGKWVGEISTQNGAMRITIALKADGENLTGTVSTQMGDQQIKEGKIKGDEVNFLTFFERDGNSVKIFNKGKVTGSEIKMSITIEGRDIAFEYTAKKES